MMKLVDSWLNFVTMYRLALYYVAGLLAAGFALGFLKLAPEDPTALAFSLVVVIAACLGANRFFAWAYAVPANAESATITALILTSILPPTTADKGWGVAALVAASLVAVASKFLLAIGRKHVFNPVAVGVAATALLLDQPASWWVGGNAALLPFTLLGGLLVARKLRRFDMLGAYVFANLAATLAFTPPAAMGEALRQGLIYSPLLFAGFAMLTEPLTSPEARRPRLAFGAIVGALSAPTIHFGDFYLTPEIAFLVGNAYAYAASPKGRLKLTLLRVERTAADCYDFVFRPDRKIAYLPGQYLDWTLEVANPDARGNRRAFTIASAPSDEDLRLGVKFYPDSSAFKRSLAAMQPGDAIFASQLAGAFTLPEDASQKLAFIAGGIGVTPFRSMVRDLVSRQDKRSVVMLYGANRADEFAYAGLFARAERELGHRTVYAVAEGEATSLGAHRGLIDAALVEREIPDFRERVFYLSGPWAMVTAFQRMLKDMGVARARIKVDYFPGLA